MSSLAWVDKSFIAAEVGFVSTIIVNSFLIYIIIFYTKQVFGAYKYLIVVFSLMGILFAAAEFLIKPMTHNYNVSFTFFSVSRPFGCSKDVARVILAGYSSTYAATISLLAVQFIYRYWAIFHQRRVRHFNGFRFLIWIFFAMMFGIDWSSSVYFLGFPDDYSQEYLRSEIRQHYDLNISDLAHFSAVVYDGDMNFRWRSIGVMANVSKVMMVQYAVMIYCGTFMHRKMGEQLEKFSVKNQKMHKQLFKTLVIQITVPTFTIFMPVMIMFMLPFFNLKLGLPTGIVLCALSLYPPMDGIIVILIVSDYRKASLGIIHNAVRRLTCNRVHLIPAQHMDITASVTDKFSRNQRVSAYNSAF